MLTSAISLILWIIGAIASAFLLILALSYVFRKLAEAFEWLALKASDPFGMKERRERRQREKEEAERQRREAEKQARQQQQQQKHQHNQQNGQNGQHSHKQQQQNAEQVKAELKEKSFMDGWREVVRRWEWELDRDLYDVEELLKRQQDRYDRLQAKYAKVRYD